MDNKAQMIAFATQKMIEFYNGNLHDIDHFLKVWSLAKTIGTPEKLDDNTQEVLELAVIVHDISCPLCREKYGNTNGKKQEIESPPLVETFFTNFSIAPRDLERISWLVAHHHTLIPMWIASTIRFCWKRISWSMLIKPLYLFDNREFPAACVPDCCRH